jgi:virginiamycin A acetyltransferase
LKFRITDSVIEALQSRRVFLRPNFSYGDALGKIIHLTNHVKVEQYGRISESSLSWDSPVEVGAFSYVVSSAVMPGCIIGRFCSIGSGVRMMGENHPLDRVTTSTWTYGEHVSNIVKDDFGVQIIQDKKLRKAGKTEIFHDVWIGENVTLKRNIKLGTGCVVGANSVVAKDVPPYAVVVGNPARVIRFRFPENEIEALLESEWWNIHPSVLARQDMSDVQTFTSDCRRFAKLHPDDYQKIDLRQLMIDFAENMGS